MHANVRKVGEVVVLDLEGKLVSGIPQEIVRDALAEIVGQGWRKILVNLNGVDSIDSSGIGELVAAHRNASRQGATIRLLQARDRVRRTLQISQILPLFGAHDDEAEALAAFG